MSSIQWRCLFLLLLDLYLPCLSWWAQLHLAGKGGKKVLRGILFQSGRRHETLLREQERQSWDVQMGTETDVRRKCVERDGRGKNRGEEWGKGCYEIWGQELLAEQGSAEVYGWLVWVYLNLWISVRYIIHADGPRCSKITVMKVLRDRRSVVRRCKLQTLQMDGRNLKE